MQTPGLSVTCVNQGLYNLGNMYVFSSKIMDTFLGGLFWGKMKIQIAEEMGLLVIFSRRGV